MVPFAKAKEPVPTIKQTPGPLFFVLHDVSANTYSRTLIPNTNIQNLHHLFQVRPRWYNRSKATCDRIGVMMIRFKHAKPLVQMVALPQTTRPVRRAVKCFDAETLSGGEGNTLATVARGVGRVAAKATTGLSTALVVGSVGAGAATLLFNRKMQQELNDTCLTKLKEQIATQMLQSSKDGKALSLSVQVRCHGKLDSADLVKDKDIGHGAFGTVWSVKDNDTVVIKEQTALCYTFINEIECLTKLKDTGIVPLLKDVYICPQKNKDLINLKNSEITYGYVMDKLDYTLEAYIKSLNNKKFDEQKEGIAKELLKILSTLTKNNIEHRDLHLQNFLVKLNAQTKMYAKIYVIDFGNARHSENTKPVYSIPVWPQPLLGNIFMFISLNTTVKLLPTFIGLIDNIVSQRIVEGL